MEERLKALEKSVSLIEAEIIEDELSVISGQSEIPEDAQQRILSSVMKKAGYALPTIRTEADGCSDNDTTLTAGIVRRRHGGAAAACIALAAAGVLGAILILDGDIQTDEVEQQNLFDNSVSEMSMVENESVSEDDSFGDESSEVQEIVSQGPNENQVKMPNLVGLDTEMAIGILDEKDLNYEIKYDGKKALTSTVQKQSVEADEVVDKGTVVELYVSGEEQYLLEIPVPVGLSGDCKFTVCKVMNDDREITISSSYMNSIEFFAGTSMKFLLNAEPGDIIAVYYTLPESANPEKQLYIRYILTDDGEFVLDGEQDNDGSASG